MCILAIDYFAQYHTKNFFHGDIKPHNIFFDLVGYNIEITSDIGSLLYLGGLNEK